MPAQPNSISPKKTASKKKPKTKRPLLAEQTIYFDGAEVDPLADYRAAAAHAGAATHTESDVGTTNRTDLLNKIFKAMDSDSDGLVQFEHLTKVIAMAHSSGSTGRLHGTGTPRRGSTGISTPRHGLPSARAQPVTALVLPDEFGVEVWLSEMGRMASLMEDDHFEANILGLFDCFRDEAGTAATLTAATLTGDEDPSCLGVISKVVLHADLRVAGTMAAVCKALYRTLQDDDSLWQTMCTRVASEHLLYVPKGVGACPNPEGWRPHFQRLWSQRHTWLASPLSEGSASMARQRGPMRAARAFNVSVAVRFRPAVPTAGGLDVSKATMGEDEEETVIIPLHQKVAMVRAKRKCSQVFNMWRACPAATRA